MSKKIVFRFMIALFIFGFSSCVDIGGSIWVDIHNYHYETAQNIDIIFKDNNEILDTKNMTVAAFSGGYCYFEAPKYGTYTVELKPNGGSINLPYGGSIDLTIDYGSEIFHIINVYEYDEYYGYAWKGWYHTNQYYNK